MKLFKIIILLIIVLGISVLIYYSRQNKSFNPISSQNDFYSKLNLAIQTSQLKISQFNIQDFNNEVEFYLIDGDNQIKTLFSTKKDPYWQISSLQEILKTAKIKDKKLKLVDLSSTHPYATFKNN
jgi:uncharacterized protein YxeA